MYWTFNPIPNDDIEHGGSTSDDEFENEDQNLAESLVREFLQNTLDALPVDNKAKVEFRSQGLEEGFQPEFARKIFEGHLEHAHARECHVDFDEVDFDRPTGLVIEEFGTTGLSGPLVNRREDSDGANWTNFWFVHGKQTKYKGERGRHGLGKRVFSLSSALGTFFGITVRDDGLEEQYLMGQTRLEPHWCGDGGDRHLYRAHGWFSELSQDPRHKGMPIPITDSGFVTDAKKNFGIERTVSQSGLSVFIPFPKKRLERSDMIREAITSFFFPIITGQLTLSFDDIEINSGTISDLAKKYASDRIADTDELFAFVSEAWSVAQGTSTTPLISVTSNWWENKELDSDDFNDRELEQARNAYKNGELLAIQLPVELSHKERGDLRTFYHIFIKRPAELDQGRDLYVRKGLRIPQEKWFDGRPSLGLLLVEEEDMADFVGDAENPAHTKLTGRKKLERNWNNSQKTIFTVRRSLRDFFDVLSSSVNDEDEFALMNFFWSPGTKSKKKKKSKGNQGIVDKLPNSKGAYQIDRVSDGVRVHSTKNPPQVPANVILEVAYDVQRGSAFSKWKPFDFELDPAKGLINSSLSGAKITTYEGNKVHLEITRTDFSVKLTGFGKDRDLKARIKQVDSL
jgi:hypothetical protein